MHIKWLIHLASSHMWKPRETTRKMKKNTSVLLFMSLFYYSAILASCHQKWKLKIYPKPKGISFDKMFSPISIHFYSATQFCSVRKGFHPTSVVGEGSILFLFLFTNESRNKEHSFPIKEKTERQEQVFLTYTYKVKKNEKRKKKLGWRLCSFNFLRFPAYNFYTLMPQKGNSLLYYFFNKEVIC